VQIIKALPPNGDQFVALPPAGELSIALLSRQDPMPPARLLEYARKCLGLQSELLGDAHA